MPIVNITPEKLQDIIKETDFVRQSMLDISKYQEIPLISKEAQKNLQEAIANIIVFRIEVKSLLEKISDKPTTKP